MGQLMLLSFKTQYRIFISCIDNGRMKNDLNHIEWLDEYDLYACSTKAHTLFLRLLSRNIRIHVTLCVIYSSVDVLRFLQHNVIIPYS